MKKRRLVPTTYTTASKPVQKQPEEKPKNPKTSKVLEDDGEDENSGFGKWLRTGEGVEFMKYFVVLNSIGVFIAMGWPSISKSYQIIKSLFVDDEEVI